MKISQITLIILAIGLIASGCGSISQQDVIEVLSAVEQTAAAGVTFVPAESTADLNQIVQATFQAMTIQAAALPTDVPSSTPSPTQGATDNIPTQTPPGGQSGSISGTLSYPAEGIPAMAIIAFTAGGSPNDYYYVTTDQGANTYQIDNLPVAAYHIVAYTLGGGGFPAGLAGGYTLAVPCGLSVNCTDHSLIPVQVNNGQVSLNANPQDWYAPVGTFPAYPLP